jgi:hypothetical protein
MRKRMPMRHGVYPARRYAQYDLKIGWKIIK